MNRGRYKLLCQASQVLPSGLIPILVNFLSVRARFQYDRGMEHSLFVLLIFPRLKFKRALCEAKKSYKKNKDYFIPRS